MSKLEMTSKDEVKNFELKFDKKFITRSLRGQNYDLETALSELVDNSIDADSNNIKITFPKKSERNESSLIIIEDDGFGMSESELINSMTLGSDRDYQDTEIGYFGIGMKASLAYLSEKVLIKTKKSGDNFYSIIEWNIDEDISFSLRSEKTSDMEKSGTTIFINPGWRYDHYSHTQESVVIKKFGARYFHILYTSDDQIDKYSKQSRIIVNGVIVEPLDPMYRNGSETEIYTTNPIVLNEDLIHITGYFLKKYENSDLLSKYDIRQGNKGSMSFDQHGIYVLYNNKFINLGGTFLGAIKTHPSFNHLRIELSIPKSATEYFGISMNKNSLTELLREDGMWDSTREKIKKSISEITSLYSRDIEKYVNSKNQKDPEKFKNLSKNGNNVNNELKSKGITKTPLSDPEISKNVVNSTEFDKKSPKGTKNRPDSLTYEKKLFDIVPYSGGESNEFWELNRSNTKILIRLNIDHIFYKEFLSNSSDDEQKKIIKLLYSLAWAQLDTLGSYHFDGRINDLWSDFWNTASRALKRTLS